MHKTGCAMCAIYASCAGTAAHRHNNLIMMNLGLGFGTSKMHISHPIRPPPPPLPGGLGCCPFWGSGSVVVDLLFGVLPIGCGGSVFVFVLLCITL